MHVFLKNALGEGILLEERANLVDEKIRMKRELDTLRPRNERVEKELDALRVEVEQLRGDLKKEREARVGASLVGAGLAILVALMWSLWHALSEA